MKIPRPKSIFARILLTSLLPISLLAVLLSTYLINARLDDQQAAFNERGNATAQQLAALAVVGLFSGDISMLQGSCEQLVRSSQAVSRAEVRDRDDEIVAAAGRGDARDATPEQPAYSAFVIPPYVAIDRSVSGRGHVDPLGRVVVYYDTRTRELARDRILRNALVIALLSVALAMLLTLVVARQIVRPIRTLRKAVASIRDGDLGTRVTPVSYGELGDLQSGFNTMAERIDSSARSLQDQVDQATCELRQALQDLESRNADLERAREREHAANRAKSAFLANMSHEIRTPMNGVLGFAGLLQKTQLNDTQREFLDTITRSANNLLTIINDILDFSQMEAGRLQIEQVPFSVRDAIDDVAGLLTPEAHGKGLDLIPFVEASVPETVVGDVTRLRHVLTNLVSNAVKFTERGEVIMHVREVGGENGALVLELGVSDTGIGIADDALRDLFEPFSQGPLSTRRLYGGTGLGLSICRSLVQAMGGSIDVQSAPGEGSHFAVRLPFARDTVTGQRPGERIADNAHTVVVIDAHPVSRAALEQAVQFAGLGCRSYAQFGDITAIEPVSVWLVRLPAPTSRRDIVSTLDAIRVRSRSPACLLLTSADPQLKQFAQQQDACCVQTYPARSRTMIGTVRKCVGQRERILPIAEESGAPARESLAGTTVLIVDDNPINLRLLDALMRSHGATTLQAENAQDALHLAREHRVGLLVADIHMPGMDGVELAEAFRALAGYADVPVIALTADVHFQAGPGHAGMFDACLTKPLDHKKLQGALDSVMDNGADPAATADPTETAGREGRVAVVRDRARAIEIAGGDEEVADDVFGALLESLPGQLTTVQRQYGNRDWEAMWQSVHRLLGSASICGVPALYQALEALQAAIDGSHEARVARALSRLQREADRLVAASTRPG